MSESILVFGGAGFIGTHLLKRLSRETNAKLISVDRKAPKTVLEGVEYLNQDVRDLSNLSVTGDVSRIYNLAAIHTTPGHPTHEYYETNIGGALEIVKFAEKHGINELVFTSSISVYGPSEEQKTEQSTPAPTSAYGYSKLLAEKIHRDWLERAPDSRKLTVVRPAVVFGPGEGGNFTRLASLLRKGFFIYPGRRDTIKACIYVADLLGAIEFARSQPGNYTLFNGAYPGPYTLEQIVETLIKDHFKSARTVLLPKGAVTGSAKILAGADFLKLGLHPERVLKLVRSTDVYPGWLVANKFQYPESLSQVFDRWSRETNGTFV